ncbi:MAG TPA: PP2C family protein-serine/threonine phosphatase [Thermoanaerobaculia bacterium]|nr:PP2C family protein-serine/threonine phosphatase [Thermoanaerobaculia bacterium]
MIGFGALFATIFAFVGNTRGFELVATAAVGAVMGVTIWISISALLILFRPTIHRLPEGFHQIAFGALFLAAGILGYVGGALLAQLLLGHIIKINVRGMIRMRALPYMLITGGLVVVVGLVFRTLDLLRERLADSIEKLKQHEWAEKELELARLIQTRLLPPQRIEGHGFSIAARNFPAHLVAGDFYDVVHHDDGSIAVIVADVAGKGIGASLIMASVKAVLPFIGNGSVEEAMTKLNAKLVQELDRREFVALAYARFFPSDGTLHLANAGFPDPYLIRDSVVQPLSVGGVRLPLGIRGDFHYETLTTKLEPRDRLVFVSDGIPEAPVGDGQPLGYERLAEALRNGTTGSTDEWLEDLLARIRRDVLEPLADDWTALVLEFTASARIAA